MNIMHNILASYALPERDLSPPNSGSLTTAEENGIQQMLEMRGADEFNELSPRFQEWLSGGAGKQIKRDYIAYRVARADDDERREILEGL